MKLLTEKELEQDFIKEFGEEELKKLKKAAEEHLAVSINEYNGRFIQAVLFTIGFQCIEVERYRKYHNFKITWDQYKSWLMKHRESIINLEISLDDMDILSYVAGDYDFLFGDENE